MSIADLTQIELITANKYLKSVQIYKIYQKTDCRSFQKSDTASPLYIGVSRVFNWHEW